MHPILVLTTIGTDANAHAIARELVERRLCACVNIVAGVQSVYRWEGRIEEEGEQLLLIKTTDERLAALQDALFAMHPYEVPELAVVPIELVESAYRDWFFDSL